MKKILSFFLVSLSIALKAQSWCAPGATWHYPVVGNGSAYYKISYVRDTVINNQIHNVLAFRKEGIIGVWMSPFLETGILCTHKSNNVVYLGNDTLFSIDLPIGTKWRMAIASTSRCPTMLTALDTGRLNICGKNLKFMSDWF